MQMSREQLIRDAERYVVCLPTGGGEPVDPVQAIMPLGSIHNGTAYIGREPDDTGPRATTWRYPTPKELRDFYRLDWTITKGNFSVELVLHTRNKVTGQEAFTFKYAYERQIHAEFMTHRWSRNASSSRAIPIARMNKWIADDPALPIHLGTNRSGMQAGAECDDPEGAREYLLKMLQEMFGHCDVLISKYNLHKEIVNRYTEPWGWINVVATMGLAQMHNAFNLRLSKYAHPNIQRVFANQCRLVQASTPMELEPGEWHLPFIEDISEYASLDEKKIWSAARSAWVSYETVDEKDATWEHAVRRHDDCVNLKHATPLEHQLECRADDAQKGCVPGYNSYRMMIPGESAPSFDYEKFNQEYGDRDYLLPS